MNSGSTSVLCVGFSWINTILYDLTGICSIEFCLARQNSRHTPKSSWRLSSLTLSKWQTLIQSWKLWQQYHGGVLSGCHTDEINLIQFDWCNWWEKGNRLWRIIHWAGGSYLLWIVVVVPFWAIVILIVVLCCKWLITRQILNHWGAPTKNNKRDRCRCGFATFQQHCHINCQQFVISSVLKDHSDWNVNQEGMCFSWGCDIQSCINAT